jgi:hypothetical protein
MGLSVVTGVNASSHREAPLISQDPVADNTDVYAFVSPDKPDSVTLIANWIPAEDPASGPNYFRFGEDVLYEIKVDNDGDAVEDVTYEWRFRNEIVNPDTFLYATDSITDVEQDAYNFKQRYDLFEVRDGVRTALLENAIMPPDNVGPASTPDYEALVAQTTYDVTTPGGPGRTFSGQRDDAFFADIGSIFDLGQLRPFLEDYNPAPRNAQEGVDFFAGYNVHTTSIEVPIGALTQGDEDVIGVWSTASRPKVRVFNQNLGSNPVNRGRFVQVSRLGNPLINEVVIPLGVKDTFNTLAPSQDAAALSLAEPREDGVTIPLVQDPELAMLLTKLYDIETPEPPRDDLVEVFLTGIPDLNQPANVTPSEMLRLNTSIPPTQPDDDSFSPLGVIGGDMAGFPNGRRPVDDVIDISLRVVAGVLVEGFNESPNNELADGVEGNDQAFLGTFPFQSTPWQGYGENNELRGKQTSGDTTTGQQ